MAEDKMKWNRFERTFNNNPWLRLHVGPPWLVSLPLNAPADTAEAKLREYVRKHLEYIAFRPLSELNLSEVRDSHQVERITHPQYPNVGFWKGYSVQHTLRFHIVGPDAPFERARYLDEGSATDVIAGLVDWHSQYWLQAGCALKLDALVRKAKHFNDVENFHVGTVDVYKFPSDFELPQLVKQAA